MGHISGSLPEGPFRTERELTGGEAGPQVGRKRLKRDTGIRKEGLSWSLEVEIWQFYYALALSHDVHVCQP